MKESFGNFYDKHYKKILIIPALLLLACIIFLGYFYSQNGDFIHKDVSLTGGTTITIFTNVSSSELTEALSSKLSDFSVTSISDNSGVQTGLIVTSPGKPEEIQPAIEEFLGYGLTASNSNLEFTGSNLSQDFYNQLVRALIFAFFLMALVVFFVFGESKKIKTFSLIITLATAKLTFPSSSFINGFSIAAALGVAIYGLYALKNKIDRLQTLAILAVFLIILFLPNYYLIIPIGILLLFAYTRYSVPSIAVIAAAFADIIMTLAVVDLFGFKLSSAGIIAFLMLIGYSVDTDILLTARVLRRKTSVNRAIFGAFTTGIMMTLTAIAAIAIALVLVYNFQSILNQIFIIMIIGLVFDIFNTWVTNASMIKWYAERKK